MLWLICLPGGAVDLSTKNAEFLKLTERAPAIQ
jgi:hypothetical protein